jgi:Family of unknown function (DUF6011)
MDTMIAGSVQDLVEFLKTQERSTFCQSLVKFFGEKGFLTKSQIACAVRIRDTAPSTPVLPAWLVKQRETDDQVRAAKTETIVTGKGLYWTATRDAIEVRESQSGRLYGMLIDDHGHRTYKPGITAYITEKMSATDIGSWGQRTARCLICSRTLTDPESITRGIGPICYQGL